MGFQKKKRGRVLHSHILSLTPYALSLSLSTTTAASTTPRDGDDDDDRERPSSPFVVVVSVVVVVEEVFFEDVLEMAFPPEHHQHRTDARPPP